MHVRSSRIAGRAVTLQAAEGAVALRRALTRRIEGRRVAFIRRLEGRLGANHSSKLDWQHDLDRRNLLTALGLGVIHVTWDKVTNRPDEFLAEVRDAQARRT